MERPYEISAAMPELPEVETVRRGLQPTLEGARFRQGRDPPSQPALPLS